MAETTKIEWCDHTFNAWIGCTRVGPPCDHCYAESMAGRYGWAEWGPGKPRKRTSVSYWKQPFAWDKAAKAKGKRGKVFSLSLGDWLDNEVPDQWREDLAQVIEATPNLDWLLLSKRIQNFGKRAPWHDNDVPANVWLGITCGDQAEYNRDWPKLARIGARVRFISYEPALGPLMPTEAPDGTLPSWIICGGESGPGARTMDPAWARNLRDECKASSIAYFFKQMTKKATIPADLLIREFPQ